MNKKITSTALAALMIAGSTSFSAFAAMSSGTVVIGTKAYDIDYANDPTNATEISAAILAGGTVYFKDFNGNWVDNVTGASVNASVIPAVTYTNSKGSTQIGAGDATVTTATSVTTAAVNAKSFKATFNGTVADTSKVVFVVKQGSAVVSTITAGWNTAKTEATLTNASNLPAGDYTVNVVNDGKDFGTSTINISSQKIAKIDITSTKLGLGNIPKGGTSADRVGYATYKVLDQYGNDITTTSLANGLTFQSGVGSATGKDGVITVTPSANMNILQLSTVVISAYDTTTGVNKSATLAVTSQVGTLSDINISAITNKDGKVLTAQDTSSLFYLTYTATDVSGNPTTDYNIVKNGLILIDGTDELTGTNAYITTKVVHDPTDSKKAAIQVQVKSATDTNSIDMPIVINAMTYTGKSSILNVIMKREAKVDSIQLQVPSYNIATGEDKIIPFVALDQNGKVLTKYADVVTKDVSISGAFWSKDANGDAVLRIGDQVGDTGRGIGYPNDGQRTITASVASSTGKYSTITVNVQKKVMADTLSLDTSKYQTIMQAVQGTDAAIQRVDFGWDKEGLSVKDQYDRVIDMTTGADSSNTISQYYVKAVSSAPTVVGVSYQDKDKNDTTATSLATGNKYLALKAGAAGSATITFELYNTDRYKSDGITLRTAADIASPVDSQSQTFTVLDNKDIKDYVMDEVTNPIYADIDHNTKTVSDRQLDYKANPKVYGTTSSGSKVLLAGNPIISASVDSKDFAIAKGPKTEGGSCAYDAIKVVALDFADSAKTGSSTKLTVSIQGADKTIYVKTADIKSSTVDPVASSIYASVSTEVKGISKDNDTITLTQSAGNSYADMLGNSLSQYLPNGAKASTQNVYIGAKDQYGQDSMALSSFLTVNDITKTKLATGSDFKVALDGTITGTAQPGDFITVTGVSQSGPNKTIKIVFAGTGAVVDAGLTNATTAVATAQKAQSQVKVDAAQALVSALTASTDKDALQSKINAIVVLSNAQLKTATIVEFNTNLAANNNTLLGGTVNNTAKTITVTDPTATTNTGVFDTLAKLNVTSVSLGGTVDATTGVITGGTVINLADKNAAKAAVLAYFNTNGLSKDAVVSLNVTGTNGVAAVKTYTLLGIN
ncbi:hypothetical protein [Clostridium estertheticum]|uniref:Uncharacterized protein n=1 Tax=Clostridium estertheticum subsp. estertheticum TaxID=1552 RepID=A0A1J0GL06_9CLOT|nr:hypothetical protein [Clostridium estertheticum]APC41959.1 hypothetical protein A7L45_18760 [Clostridium estertheticum subsp. estertheticum]MBU3073187.1 cell wall-binding repeat-containing protein [Clostridium estertheticum]MBU3163572.1 cell wall-binding repeat-containing protein [Clostridium estertheticum]MBU3172974.1 cell wall-binding repeat-containing protein [Clostridium estertheticum]MBZ9616136.1 cell wall-binding repeat-containing protein [Clostridium estertheticum subsp. laramiense]